MPIRGGHSQFGVCHDRRCSLQLCRPQADDKKKSDEEDRSFHFRMTMKVRDGGVADVLSTAWFGPLFFSFDFSNNNPLYREIDPISDQISLR